MADSPGLRSECIALAARVTAAYVANNSVPMADLARLIRIVHEALDSVGSPETPALRVHVPVPTRAQIRRSVDDDGLVSFVDGRTYQTLKRHLAANGLTPDAYRKRYDLPADYPMVSPGYAARRSELAKQFGLGRSRLDKPSGPSRSREPRTSSRRSDAAQ